MKDRRFLNIYNCLQRGRYDHPRGLTNWGTGGGGSEEIIIIAKLATII